MLRNATVADPDVDLDVDDLDDLDDIVDEFDEPPKKQPPTSSSTVPAPTPASTSTLSTGPNTSSITATTTTTTKDAPNANAQPDSPDAPGEIPDEKLDDLVEGMVQLLKELEGTNGTDATGRSGGTTTQSSAAAETVPSDDDPFQRSIREAMDRLRTSEANPSPATAASTTPEDPLEALLKQFGDALGEGIEGSGATGGLGSAGGDVEDAELQGMLETMMRQLMSKDVLYEPLKELNEKFPSYLATNASTISPSDKERYEQQHIRVQQIVTIFEREDYKDGDEVTGEGGMGAEVVRLMNEMQSFGTPPTEIMGPMPPGLELGSDGMPSLPEGCTIA